MQPPPPSLNALVLQLNPSLRSHQSPVPGMESSTRTTQSPVRIRFRKGHWLLATGGWRLVRVQTSGSIAERSRAPRSRSVDALRGENIHERGQVLLGFDECRGDVG